MWLLLGGVALLAVVSSLAMGRARGAAASIEWLRSTSAAESAAHDAMFRLAVGGKKALTSGSSRQMVIDGVDTQTEVLHSDGLVDLNAAQNATLGKVLAAVLGADQPRALHAIGNIGTLHSYAQLGAAEGMGAAALACLLPYVTLSSGRAMPAAEFAPARVRLALELSADKVECRDGCVVRVLGRQRSSVCRRGACGNGKRTPPGGRRAHDGTPGPTRKNPGMAVVCCARRPRAGIVDLRRPLVIGTELDLCA